MTITITTKLIRALRSEAIAAGDYAQADLCQRALSTDTIDQDGNRIPYAEMTQDDAIEACARVIANAAAQ